MAMTREERKADSDTVYVPFSREALRDVERMAAQEGKSVGRVIQEALAIQKRALAARKRGGELVIAENGKFKSLSVK